MANKWQVKIHEFHDNEAVQLYINDATAKGSLIAGFMNVSGQAWAEIDQFYASPKRKGVGTALMKALVAELKARDVDVLWSAYVSPEAMRMRLKLFGETLIQFADGPPLEPLLLPLTTEQYLQDLELGLRQPTDHPYDMPSVYVDLSRVDASEWQRPKNYPLPAPKERIIQNMNMKRNDYLKVAVVSIISIWILSLVFTASISDIYSCVGNNDNACPALKTAHWKIIVETLIMFVLWAVMMFSIIAYVVKLISKKK